MNSRMSPGIIVLGVVPNKNDNYHPRKSGFLVGWLHVPNLERTIHSDLRLCCRIDVLFCFMYFLTHLVYMLGLKI